VFSDRVTVHVEAGRGGDGSIAFRREKFVPRGGPSGGDGGRGGDVVLVADPERRDLSPLRYSPHVRATNGRHGEGSNRTGGRGDDVVVAVPVGTQVLTEDGALVADLAHAHARAVVARGGSGGGGNRRFATATRQAPRVAEIGVDGEARTLELKLKLMADAALLGFPNVGKSSLLRRISNATPKVADYPFTTIDPVLGTVDAADGTQLTVVDVPGLLEGASEGVGLGHEFLAHLERARLLVHVLDGAGADDPQALVEGFGVIDGELRGHGHGLAERSQLVVLNKVDLLDEEQREAATAAVRAALASDERVIRDDDGAPLVLRVSCATGEGVDGLVGALFRHVPAAAPATVVEDEPELADYLVFQPGRELAERVRILREEGGFRLTGGGLVERLQAVAGSEEERARALDAMLRQSGVLDRLRRAGARDGATVALGDERFTYHPDEA
jgi:GTP-binding protein